MNQDISQLQTQLQELQSRFDAHFHDGNNSQRTNFSDILGFIQTVGVAPTQPPTDIYSQIQIYNGALYFYDTSTHTWKSTSGAAFAIGGVYTNITGTNPATELGYGTWTAFATGQTLVGVDTGNSNFNTVLKTGGITDVTLSASQIPNHAHPISRGSAIGYSTQSNGGAAASTTGVAVTTVAGATLFGNTDLTTSGGSSHTNLQPYITVYFWQRTA